MNAQSIWVGHDYAYCSNRPKGVKFVRHNVKRVRALRVTKTRDRYAERATTMVDVLFVDTGRERSVRARDIISFWEDYEVQYQEYLEQEAARERERQEREAARAATVDYVVDKLLAAGIPDSAIMRPYSGSYQITINAKEVMVNEKASTAATDA